MAKMIGMAGAKKSLAGWKGGAMQKSPKKIATAAARPMAKAVKRGKTGYSSPMY